MEKRKLFFGMFSNDVLNSIFRPVCFDVLKICYLRSFSVLSSSLKGDAPRPSGAMEKRKLFVFLACSVKNSWGDGKPRPASEGVFPRITRITRLSSTQLTQLPESPEIPRLLSACSLGCSGCFWLGFCSLVCSNSFKSLSAKG